MALKLRLFNTLNRELEDFEEPDSHPRWASVSPDSSTVVYNKECNLYSMPYSEYERILEARRGETGEKADSLEAEVEVQETQLTEDGEKYYCYGSYGRGDTDNETEENWRECVQKAIELAPGCVTLYQMEIPFNTTIYKEMKDAGKLIAPVIEGDVQNLVVREKTAAGVSTQIVCQVLYVYLRGIYGVSEGLHAVNRP